MSAALPAADSGAKDKNSVQTCSTCGGSGQVRRVSNTFLGQMQTVTTCPTCNGEGSIVTAKCPVCKGEGRVYGEETVTIDIPAGVQEGMQLSVGGRGNAGERGGPPATSSSSSKKNSTLISTAMDSTSLLNYISPSPMPYSASRRKYLPSTARPRSKFRQAPKAVRYSG